MTENIRVTCLVDRYWDPASRKYEGAERAGMLIDISVEQTVNEPDRITPVGIVMLDDGTFQSVPVEFIKIEPIN